MFDAFSLDICTDYELLWCSLLLCQEHLHLIMYLPKNALHISLHKQTSTSRTSTTLYRNTLTYTYIHNIIYLYIQVLKYTITLNTLPQMLELKPNIDITYFSSFTYLNE